MMAPLSNWLRAFPYRLRWPLCFDPPLTEMEQTIFAAGLALGALAGFAVHVAILIVA